MTAARAVIRAAAPDDVPRILAMIRALAAYEKLEHLCVATESNIRSALFGPSPSAEVLLATIDELPVGFALFFHNFSTFLARRGLWLEDLFVYPEHRGAGIGRLLLRSLAGIASGGGCGRFEWAVLDWNAPAIAFYERLGATVLPDWRIVRVTGDALERMAMDDASEDHESLASPGG
ncbi:MAG TPA: GNAT family N-acetyltransferase [Casimicrobiaceae bacterium]|nr:GNAT family N-acetyltransferase [Casimicrobiaceae bacterium]